MSKIANHSKVDAPAGGPRPMGRTRSQRFKAIFCLYISTSEYIYLQKYHFVDVRIGMIYAVRIAEKTVNRNRRIVYRATRVKMIHRAAQPQPLKFTRQRLRRLVVAVSAAQEARAEKIEARARLSEPTRADAQREAVAARYARLLRCGW